MGGCEFKEWERENLQQFVKAAIDSASTQLLDLPKHQCQGWVLASAVHVHGVAEKNIMVKVEDGMAKKSYFHTPLI